jgi:hypothetical protein
VESVAEGTKTLMETSSAREANPPDSPITFAIAFPHP